MRKFDDSVGVARESRVYLRMAEAYESGSWPEQGMNVSISLGGLH